MLTFPTFLTAINVSQGMLVIFLSLTKIFTRNCQVYEIRLSNSDEVSRNNQTYTE